ncbi:hypothetical protein CVT25_013615 [Psilocybe cyanescens]|uniref:Retrotransposon gag domain-containing protein n=1 Tax=Psilocybe cyanescens TaxID=93625 RepID=A0A409W0K0_PSICY|nr:hypothetical protein CVT25_013615 [Psilocybe cyanescens]
MSGQSMEDIDLPLHPPPPPPGAFDLLINGLQATLEQIANFIPLWNTTNDNFNTTNQTFRDTIKAMGKKPINIESITIQKPKIKEPAEYNGDPDLHESFIIGCQIYLKHNKITDYKEMILYVLPLIRGGAANKATNWSTNVQKSIIEQEELNPPSFPYANWNEFKDDFTKQFGLYTSKKDAIEKIERMEQGSMNCEEYSSIFRTYGKTCGYNDEALLERYKHGLNKALKDQLMRTFPLPDDKPDGTVDLQAWIKRA